MKWEEFLAMENASNEKLYDYGFVDNFPIIWKAFSTESLIEQLRATGNYHEHTLDNDISMSQTTYHSPEQRVRLAESYANNLLEHKDGTVVINPRASNNIYTMKGLGNVLYDHVLQFQKSRYDYALRLHSSQVKRMIGISGVRAMYLVVKDIVETALLPAQVPFCLPKMFKYVQGQIEQDYSTVVYWPDSDEEEMCKK
ncbi:MAG: hypothetical protein AABY00_02485 [Nanoarchaeota archaeon]